MFHPFFLLSGPPEVTGTCSELEVQKNEEKFGGKEILRIFASAKGGQLRDTNAKIAQLVEHDLAKVGVAGSSPVFRSIEN